jgi:hypothetical protein
MSITHSVHTNHPNDASKDVSADAWNAAHVGETILFRTTQLNTAQIMALDVTPVDILPTLTGRNSYIPFRILLHYRAGATPFNVGVRFAVGWGNTPAAINDDASWGNSGSTGLINLAVDAYQAMGGGTTSGDPLYAGYLASTIEAAPLRIVYTTGFGPPTAGNGSISVRVWYAVVDGAP